MEVIHDPWQFWPHVAIVHMLWLRGALRVFPGGNQVDGLPPAPSTRNISDFGRILGSWKMNVPKIDLRSFK